MSKRKNDDKIPPLTKTETIDNVPEPPHPIATAIDKCIARLSDIRYSVNNLIPQATKYRLDELKKTKNDLHSHANILSQKNSDGASKALIIKFIIETCSKLQTFEQSEFLQILATGHFLSIYSSFDAFTGELLTAIYRKKPDLYSKLNRSMTVAELLQYENVENIKEIVLKSEVEAFRRKSYVEQFESLETTFGIELKNFDNWPLFIEAAQRRNLFTHCDGIVSDQYISVCREQGVQLEDVIKEGIRLTVPSSYLVQTCALVIEVSLKLGQTLWRKIFQNELEAADIHLERAQYNFLEKEEWLCAQMAGEFALKLRKHSKSVSKTIMTVNYLISLLRCKEDEKANAIIGALDWSALCLDFRLAECVLRRNFNEAGKLMIKIGKQGDFVKEHCYHTWPLFWEFRQTPEFAAGYRKVYGYDFTEKLKINASEAETTAQKEFQKEIAEAAKETSELKLKSMKCSAKPLVHKKLLVRKSRSNKVR